MFCETQIFDLITRNFERTHIENITNVTIFLKKHACAVEGEAIEGKYSLTTHVFAGLVPHRLKLRILVLGHLKTKKMEEKLSPSEKSSGQQMRRALSKLLYMFR